MPRLINEAPWFTLDCHDFPTTTGNTVPIDSLDARIEELGIKFKNIYDWLGPLPNGTYIHPEKGTLHQQEALTLAKNGTMILPKDWWKHAVGMLNYTIVKASINPRTEQGEQTQEQLDMNTPFPAKLDLLFGAA